MHLTPGINIKNILKIPLKCEFQIILGWLFAFSFTYSQYWKQRKGLRWKEMKLVEYLSDHLVKTPIFCQDIENRKNGGKMVLIARLLNF